MNNILTSDKEVGGFMDFYDLQDRDHDLIQNSMGPKQGRPEGQKTDPQTPLDYREYLKKQFFDFGKLAGKRCILVAEEDPRVQRAIQHMIHDENPQAVCLFADAIEEIGDVLEEVDCDLLVANYYISEDEVDYGFWEDLRSRYPSLEVIIMSHVNDKEYYALLEKLEFEGAPEQRTPWGFKMKKFFENVFGGTHGNH